MEYKKENNIKIYSEYLDSIDFLKSSDERLTNKFGEKIKICSLPDFYINFGLQKNSSIAVTAKHLYTMTKEKGYYSETNDTHYHNLGTDLLNELPYLIQEPLIVFCNTSEFKKINNTLPTTLVCCLNKNIDITKENNYLGKYPLLAFIEPPKNPTDTLSLMLTAYPEEKFSQMLEYAIKNNHLLYLKNEKFLMQNQSGITFTNPIPVDFFTTKAVIGTFYDSNIRQYKENVNIERMKINPLFLQYLSDNEKTEKVCKHALSSDVQSYLYFPKKYKSINNNLHVLQSLNTVAIQSIPLENLFDSIKLFTQNNPKISKQSDVFRITLYNRLSENQKDYLNDLINPTHEPSNKEIEIKLVEWSNGKLKLKEKPLSKTPTITQTVNNFTNNPAGVLDIIGTKIELDKNGNTNQKSLEDLAKTLEIYSDKRYETARYIFLKDGECIRHVAVSSKTPSSTVIMPDKDFLYRLKDYAEQTNSQIVFCHNHPSGYVEPSEQDIKLTKYVQNIFNTGNYDNNGNPTNKEYFAGHVILDHGTYGIYTPQNDWKAYSNGKYYPIEKTPYTYQISKNEYNLQLKTDTDLLRLSTFINEKINTQNEWNKKEWIPVTFTNLNGMVKSIEFVSVAEFDNPQQLQEKLRNIGRENNSENIYFIPYKNDFTQMALCEEFAKNTRLVKDIYFENDINGFELSEYSGGNLFPDYIKNEVSVEDTENFSKEEYLLARENNTLKESSNDNEQSREEKVEFERKSKNEIPHLKTYKTIKKKKIENLEIVSDEEFSNIIDSLFARDYKSIPSVIKLPCIHKELSKLAELENDSTFILQSRMIHINPSRKSEYNQSLTQTEYKQIPSIIRNTNYLVIDKYQNNFQILFEDENNTTKINKIVFNQDQLGNYIVTVGKVDRKFGLSEKQNQIVAVGLAPTISELRNNNYKASPTTTLRPSTTTNLNIQHVNSPVNSITQNTTINEIANNAIYIGSDISDGENPNKDIKTYDYFMGGATLNGKPYTVKTVIGYNALGEARYYDQRTTDIKKELYINNLSLITNKGEIDTQLTRKYDMRLVYLCQVPQFPYMQFNSQTNQWLPTKETIEKVKNNQLTIQKDGVTYKVNDLSNIQKQGEKNMIEPIEEVLNNTEKKENKTNELSYVDFDNADETFAKFQELTDLDNLSPEQAINLAQINAYAEYLVSKIDVSKLTPEQAVQFDYYMRIAMLNPSIDENEINKRKLMEEELHKKIEEYNREEEINFSEETTPEKIEENEKKWEELVYSEDSQKLVETTLEDILVKQESDEAKKEIIDTISLSSLIDLKTIDYDDNAEKILAEKVEEKGEEFKHAVDLEYLKQVAVHEILSEKNITNEPYDELLAKVERIDSGNAEKNDSISNEEAMLLKEIQERTVTYLATLESANVKVVYKDKEFLQNAINIVNGVEIQHAVIKDAHIAKETGCKKNQKLKEHSKDFSEKHPKIATAIKLVSTIGFGMAKTAIIASVGGTVGLAAYSAFNTVNQIRKSYNRFKENEHKKGFKNYLNYLKEDAHRGEAIALVGQIAATTISSIFSLNTNAAMSAVGGITGRRLATTVSSTGIGVVKGINASVTRKHALEEIKSIYQKYNGNITSKTIKEFEKAKNKEELQGKILSMIPSGQTISTEDTDRIIASIEIAKKNHTIRDASSNITGAAIGLAISTDILNNIQELINNIQTSSITNIPFVVGDVETEHEISVEEDYFNHLAQLEKEENLIEPSTENKFHIGKKISEQELSLENNKINNSSILDEKDPKNGAYLFMKNYLKNNNNYFLKDAKIDTVTQETQGDIDTEIYKQKFNEPQEKEVINTNVSNTSINTTDKQESKINKKLNEKTISNNFNETLKQALNEVAIPLKTIEFTRNNYNTLFPYSRVESPIESIKLGDNQFLKLEKKERERLLSAVYEVLTTPDIIINEKKNKVDKLFGDVVEKQSHIYAKSFIIDNKKKAVQSVVVSIEDDNISISTHERDINNIVNKIKTPDQLLYVGASVRHMIERLTNKSLTVNPTREIDKINPPNPKYNISSIMSIQDLIKKGKLTTINNEKTIENENSINETIKPIVKESQLPNTIEYLSYPGNHKFSGNNINKIDDFRKSLLTNNIISKDENVVLVPLFHLKTKNIEPKDNIPNVRLVQRVDGENGKPEFKEEIYYPLNSFPELKEQSITQSSQSEKVEQDKSTLFTKETAYEKYKTVPEFGLYNNDNKTMESINNARFISVNENNEVLLIQEQRDGTQKKLTIPESLYQDIIEKTENFYKSTQSLQKDSMSYVLLNEQYRKALNLDTNSLRSNLASNFQHNFKVLCEKNPTLSFNEVMDLADKELTQKMDSYQKLQMNRLNKQYPKQTAILYRNIYDNNYVEGETYSKDINYKKLSYDVGQNIKLSLLGEKPNNSYEIKSIDKKGNYILYDKEQNTEFRLSKKEFNNNVKEIEKANKKEYKRHQKVDYYER